ncbi:MAG: hypothetical protein HQL87_09010 [Magnetococcales bacterium]|nr:hypothetical protein [Magnetococcales bacterium]
MSSSEWRPQAGAAVLWMMTLLVMILAGLLLEGWTARQGRWPVWQEEVKVLGVAREALVGFYAVQGVLPTPDVASDPTRGSAPGPRQGDDPPGPAILKMIKKKGWRGLGRRFSASPEREAIVVGRLPWRALGLPPLRTEAGEAVVWYAVSPSFLLPPFSAHRLVRPDREDWAAVLFISETIPRTDESSALLPEARWLPIRAGELANRFGEDAHEAQ